MTKCEKVRLVVSHLTQEPIKPTRYQEGRWFKTWRCGACGGTLVFRNGEDKPNYCTDCGRKVKWDV